MTDDQARRDEVAVISCKANDCMHCEGTGLMLLGWTDKNGFSEDRYGTCAMGLRVADALMPLLARIEREAKAEAWDECVGWMAYQGQADVKGWLLEAAEANNPHRAALDEPTGEACDCYTPQECERLGHKR